MGAKTSMAQKESFLAQMAKLSLHTVKTIDKALQLKQVPPTARQPSVSSSRDDL